MERLAIVDLAVAVAEEELPAARDVDERNAMSRCLEIILMLHGGERAELIGRQWIEAERLFDQLRTRATALVQQHRPAIDRVAQALAGGELSQAEIDALIWDGHIENLEGGEE